MASFDMISKDLSSHVQYRKSENIVQDLKEIIDSAQKSYAFSSVNIALVFRNWLIGKRISEEELQGEMRAEYGTELLKTLAKEMEKSYGKGLNQRNLYYYVRFYDYFPQILNAVSSKSPILDFAGALQPVDRRKPDHATEISLPANCNRC
ncbi:MAG: DUF1016 family protein [Sphaerochaeta sp.]|nr:MAG: DUF1016 family protein [Sphaerochaeta sp.]